MLKSYEIILDIENELYNPTKMAFSVSQNDLETVELNFLIRQDNSNMDLTGTTLQLAIKKPSGLTVYQDIEIISALEGEARALLSNQAYIEYGIHTAELYIRANDQLAVSCPFWYSSRSAILDDETLESVNEWTALQQALFAYDLKPILTNGIPTQIPEYIGQMAFDTVNRLVFIANDLTAESWQLISSGGGEGGGGTVLWADILGKPTTFAPSAHVHEMADVTGLTEALDGKADIGAHTTLTGIWTSNNTVGAIPSTKQFTIQAATMGASTWIRFADVNAEGIDGTSVLKSQREGNVIIAQETENANNFARLKVTGNPIDGGTYFEIPITTLEVSGTGQGKMDVVFLFSIGEAQANSWDEITDKPTTFTPSAHNHLWADITDKPTTFTPTTHTHDYASITGKPTTFAPSAHNHPWTEITAKPTTFTPTAHTHLWADITDKPTTFTPSTHNHAIGDVTGLQGALDGKAPTAHTHDYASITGKPTTFTPTAHTHTFAEIPGLQAELDSKLEAIPTEYLTQSEGDTRYAFKGEGGTGGGDTLVEDVLTSTSTSAALSANQGRVLNETKSDVTHNHDGVYAPTNHNHDGDYAPLIHNHDQAYAPITHTHAIADVTGLQGALDGKADDVHTHLWTDITDKPTTFAPSAHTHDEYLTEAEGNALYALKEDVGGTVAWVDITGKPTTFTPSAHTHLWADLTDKPTTFAPTAHTHTKAQITDFAHTHLWADLTDKPTTFTPSTHTHAYVDITGKPSSFTPSAHTHVKADITDFAHTHLWADLTDKPTTFTPSAHTHLWADITDKPTTFTPTAHTHAIADVTGLQTALDGKVDDGELANYDTRTVADGKYAKTVNVYSKTAVDTALDGKVNTTQGLSIWQGTQTAYNGLTKDPNTLYFITGA